MVCPTPNSSAWEISIMVYLERTYPKEAILEEYFSTIPLGRGSYGVEAASLAWYGRKSGEVEIAQAAHLASLAAGTSDRNEILENLEHQGRQATNWLRNEKYPFPNLSNRLSIRVLNIK